MSQKFSIAGLRTSRTAMRTVFASLLIGAAAISVQPSFAQGFGHHRGAEQGDMMGGGRHMGRMLDAVGATDAQRAQIKQIHAAAAADMKPLLESGRGLRERGRQLMVAPGAVDRGAAETLRLDTMALQNTISKRRLDAMLAVADVLTPEQRAKIGDMMAKRGQRMGERMKRHQGDATPKS
ncbi:MAG: Spy/CpxP family protein refolding chaperone [Ideonella sp.]